MATQGRRIIEIKDREQFEDAQNKYLEYKGQYLQTSRMVEVLQNEKRKVELTLQQLEETPANTKTYQQIGRMFLLTPRTDIEKSIKQNIQKNEDQREEYEKKRKYLETRLNQTSKQMQDLIVERKDQPEEKGKSTEKTQKQ